MFKRLQHRTVVQCNAFDVANTNANIVLAVFLIQKQRLQNWIIERPYLLENTMSTKEIIIAHTVYGSNLKFLWFEES